MESQDAVNSEDRGERWIESCSDGLPTVGGDVDRLPPKSPCFPVVPPPRVGLKNPEPTALAAGVQCGVNQPSSPEASAYGSAKKTDSSGQPPVVPPPRVVPPPDESQLDDPSSQPPIVATAERRPEQTEVAASNSRVWWTLTTPLAAVTLIAVTIAIIRQPERVTNEPRVVGVRLAVPASNDVGTQVPSVAETAALIRDSLLAEIDRLPTATDARPQARRKAEAIDEKGNAPSEPLIDISDLQRADPILETLSPKHSTEKHVEPANLDAPNSTEAAQQAEPGLQHPNLVPTGLSADEVVAVALEAEVLGKQQRRQQFLAQVLKEDPEHPAANWQMGRVIWGDDWLDIAEAQERAKASPVLAAYKRMRSANDNGSVEGNLTLARWCRARRPQASRVYYTRLLNDSTVTNPVIKREAAKSLQLVPYRGQYLSATELERQKEFQRRYQQASHRWQPSLNRWLKLLRLASREKNKRQAIEEMEAVDDPDIAQVANRYAGQGSELFDATIVETLARFSTPESSQCLAQYGVKTLWPEVSQNAADILRTRKLHDYVPQLMGSLVGMTTSEGNVEESGDGTIRFQHVFRQENATYNREQRTTRDAERRIEFAPEIIERILSGEETDLARLIDVDQQTDEAERLTSMFNDELARRRALADSANRMAQRSNQPIYRLLSQSTGNQLPDDPIAWWNWWQDYNNIHLEKDDQVYSDSDRLTYTARVGPRQHHSCFVAGTLVATETGMQPIEEIVAGDRVYAKHPDTGELKLQTVMATTQNPSSPILELRIDGETIRVSPGHPFWVTGHGWRMAKLLEAGDRLHGLRGVLHLEAIRPLTQSQTVYNMIVDQFDTYFVGSSLALVHDNTFRQPTPARVPGL